MVARSYDLGHSIVFTLNTQEGSNSTARLSIGSTIMEPMYHKVIKIYRDNAAPPGFAKGTAPLTYIETVFKTPIIEHLKELLFIHCVENALYRALRLSKTVIAGEARLTAITISPPSHAEFTFEFTPVLPTVPSDLHHYPFKAPQRKNYKDLDRQVTSFIKDEQEREQNASTHYTIGIGDWVCFDVELIDEEHNKPLCAGYKDRLWLRISDEEIDTPSRELFLGKKCGDSFTLQSPFLQSYLSQQCENLYTCAVTIYDCIPSHFFSLDQLKKHFKLKTPKDVHAKLIEVFSHRNDLSQRRETVESVLKLLRSHSSVILPQQHITQQRKALLELIQKSPDYHVYKAQRDFEEKVYLLAKKQLAETILIDHLSFDHTIAASHEDVACYFNLLKRPRTKEFIYFDLPNTRPRGMEQPIPHEIIQRACLREKTLNNLIYLLTKR